MDTSFGTLTARVATSNPLTSNPQQDRAVCATGRPRGMRCEIEEVTEVMSMTVDSFLLGIQVGILLMCFWTWLVAERSADYGGEGPRSRSGRRA